MINEMEANKCWFLIFFPLVVVSTSEKSRVVFIQIILDKCANVSKFLTLNLGYTIRH
jgi:hypothetical protein